MFPLGRPILVRLLFRSFAPRDSLALIFPLPFALYTDIDVSTLVIRHGFDI